MRPIVKKTVFWLALIAILLGFTATALRVAAPLIAERLQPQLVEYAFTHLSDEEKAEFYTRVATSVESMADTVPEPLVARLLQKDSSFVNNQADVRSNNAGMRSSREYVRKPKEVFRIVCLGDSFVFGTGAREEDRFADQIEEFYRSSSITVNERPIEVYALGLGSWTAIQEASYLSSRITEYDPDVILVLTVANDITTPFGVTGKGLLTSAFSPPERSWGSGVFTNKAGGPFGVSDYSALTWDLTPASHEFWHKALASFERLATLQHLRGGHILFASLPVWGFSHCFDEIYRTYYHESMIDAPFVTTGFFPGEGTRLDHDSHPNRMGHQILANHFIHAFSSLQWVPVPEDLLPDLHRKLSLDLEVAPSPENVRECKQQLSDTLKPALHFDSLEASDTTAFLGGIFPERGGDEAFHAPPWASTRSGFLLRSPTAEREFTVTIDIEIPSRIELFPFHLEVFVNGRDAVGFDFTRQDAGPQTLTIDHVEALPDRRAIEIVMETASFFTTIDDHRMKSFRLVSARSQ
jgi:hypothetical protein